MHGKYLNLSVGIILVIIHIEYQITITKDTLCARRRSLGLGASGIW
jgi:hypothetical protein